MSASDSLPLACSLTPGELARREHEIRALIRDELIASQRTPAGVLLRFPLAGPVEAAVSDLVRRERECCAFLSFELTRRDDELVLRVEGPQEARPVIDGFARLASAGR